MKKSGSEETSIDAHTFHWWKPARTACRNEIDRRNETYRNPWVAGRSGGNLPSY